MKFTRALSILLILTALLSSCVSEPSQDDTQDTFGMEDAAFAPSDEEPVEMITDPPTVDLATFEPIASDVSDLYPIDGTKTISTNFDEIISQGDLISSDFLNYVFVPEKIEFFIVRKNDKLGLTNLDGSLVLPFEYSQIYYADSQTLVGVSQSGITLFDFSGNAVTKLKNEIVEINKMVDGIARIKTQDGLYGYVGRDGEYILEPQYPYAADFKSGTAIVQLENEIYAVIDKRGTLIFQNRDFIYYYKDSVIFTLTLDTSPFDMRVIGVDGVLYEYKDLTTYEHGVYPEIKDSYTILEKMVEIGDEVTYRHFIIDSMGNPLVEKLPEPEEGEEATTGESEEEDEEEVHELKTDFEWVVSIEDSGIVVKDNGGLTSGLLNYDGVYTPFEGFIIPGFSQERGQPILISADNKYGYANSFGEIIIEPIYEMAYEFVNGRAVVVSGSEKGVIDAKGNYIVPLSNGYDEIFAMDDKYMRYSVIKDIPDYKFGIMSYEGVTLSEPIYQEIYRFGENAYLCRREENQWYMLTGEGAVVAGPITNVRYTLDKAGRHNIAFKHNGVWSIMYYK